MAVQILTDLFYSKNVAGVFLDPELGTRWFKVRSLEFGVAVQILTDLF